MSKLPEGWSLPPGSRPPVYNDPHGRSWAIVPTACVQAMRDGPARMLPPTRTYAAINGGPAVNLFDNFRWIIEKMRADMIQPRPPVQAAAGGTPTMTPEEREAMAQLLSRVPTMSAFEDFINDEFGELTTEINRLKAENATLKAELARGDSWLDIENGKLRSILEEVEWRGWVPFLSGVTGCPFCGAMESKGQHDPGCRLKAAIDS